MARYLTISTIGPKAVPFTNLSPEEAVNKMMDFWAKQLDQVLPDMPDLIVPPEACDRYEGIGNDDREKYYAERGDKMLKFFCKKLKKITAISRILRRFSFPTGLSATAPS